MSHLAGARPGVADLGEGFAEVASPAATTSSPPPTPRTVSTPLTTSDIALGGYEVDVTAADSGGDTITLARAGWLNFLDEPQFPRFTSNATASTFNVDKPDVTFSGVATILAPDGTSTPMANTMIILQGPSYGFVATKSDGSFSATVQAFTGSYYVEYNGNWYGAGQSAAIQITVAKFPVRLTASLSTPHVANPGDPENITGMLTYTDGGVTKPLAGVTVSIYGRPVPGQPGRGNVADQLGWDVQRICAYFAQHHLDRRLRQPERVLRVGGSGQPADDRVAA